MSKPQIHGKRPVVSASQVLSGLGDCLSRIKSEDRLTFADIGRVLGKSDDQAAKYCEGSAEMGVTAFYFAKQAWNGRFTGKTDALILGLADPTCDRAKQSKLLHAALALATALEDEVLEDHEIVRDREIYEGARHALTQILARIGADSNVHPIAKHGSDAA